MVIDDTIIPFWVWVLPFLLRFAIVTFIGGGLCVFIGFLLAAAQNGPQRAVAITGSMIASIFSDVVQTSPRRIFAMVRLTLKDAIQRRAYIVFAVFVVIMLLAGWFLDVKSDHPERQYLGVVMGTANALIVILAIFLSAFSIPSEIKSKVVFTVVTKPVRTSEIVLGRVIGFGVVGTVFLVFMCLCSYVFVIRGMTHSHGIVAEKKAAGVEQTTRNAWHRHTVTMDKDKKQYVTDQVMGHRHQVTTDDKNAHSLGSPYGALQARVPIYGNLTFLDRYGKPKDKGINVGDEWAYRSHIAGDYPNPKSAAFYTFSGVTPGAFPKAQFPTIPLELNVHAYRSEKGDIERGLRGQVQLVNPSTKLKSVPFSFTAMDWETDTMNFPRKLLAIDASGTRKVDFFKDIVDNGNVIIDIRCMEPAQYMGMARADVYFRAGNQSFFWNFVKGYMGIWFQMMLVITLGVTCSTFLNGPIALLATISCIVTGFFSDFIGKLVSGEIMGGGPVEAMYRIVLQMNVTQPLDPGFATTIIQYVDGVLLFLMGLTRELLPDFSKFENSVYVAYGFNIPSLDVVGHDLVIVMCYVVVVSLFGVIMLKTREIGA